MPVLRDPLPEFNARRGDLAAFGRREGPNERGGTLRALRSRQGTA